VSGTKKGKSCLSSFFQKRGRAIDEIDMTERRYISGHASVDGDSEEVLAVMVTDMGCSINSFRILKGIMKKCKGKLPDGGKWYGIHGLCKYMVSIIYAAIRFGPRSASFLR